MSKNDQVDGKIEQQQQLACNQMIKNDIYRDRLVYNSGVKPKEIEALFTHVPTVYGQVIRVSVKAAKGNDKISKLVASSESVGKRSDHANSHVANSNPSPHISTTAEVVSGVKIPNKDISLSSCKGGNECASKVNESIGSYVQDSNPSLITSATAEVVSSVEVLNNSKSANHMGNDESVSKNSAIASLNVQDSNPSALTKVPNVDSDISPRFQMLTVIFFTSGVVSRLSISGMSHWEIN